MVLQHPFSIYPCMIWITLKSGLSPSRVYFLAKNYSIIIIIIYPSLLSTANDFVAKAQR